MSLPIQLNVAALTLKVTSHNPVTAYEPAYVQRRSSHMQQHSGGSRPGVWGVQSNWGRQEGLHLLKYQSLSATIVGCNTKVVAFCRPKSGYFCWSNYAIFQGKTTVWKRFVSLIQNRFESGPKQWVSFFASYTDLVYLQTVFKRYNSILRASVCDCFGYP